MDFIRMKAQRREKEGGRKEGCRKNQLARPLARKDRGRE